MKGNSENHLPSDTSNRLQTVTLSAVYNIVLQLSLRVVTFVSNAFYLRFVSNEILGLINVRLLLLYTTIQFTSREAIRRSCAPNCKNTENVNKKEEQENFHWPEVVNVTSLTVPISILMGTCWSAIWYWHMEVPQEKLGPHYCYGIISIFMSVIIEMLAESCFIYGQRNDFIRLKVLIEGVFQLVRCLLLSLTVFVSPENAILGFAFAQLMASSVYSLCYFYYFTQIKGLPISHFLPSMSTKPFLNPHLKKIASSFFLNTLLKQFLTEGERYMMTFFSVLNLAEQGIYDVINNLGSLPARLVFAQIEENAYLLFSSIVKREVAPEKQKQSITESLSICVKLVRSMFLLGLILFVYGFNCAELALFFYGGRSKISGEDGRLAIILLQWHCFYILLIALNGILESFSFAAMSSEKVNQFNFKMLLLSVFFLLVSWKTTGWFGAQGFLMANCINMLLRIAISFHFIGQLSAQVSSLLVFIRKCLWPDFLVSLSFGIAFVSLSTARSTLLGNNLSREALSSVLLPSALFVVVTGSLLCLHMLLIYYRESELVHFIRTELLQKRQTAKSKTS